MDDGSSPRIKPAAVESAIRQLLTDYDELNREAIDELTEQPSALEFMRYVGHNRPFVVRGAAADWEAVQRWTRDYLVECLADARMKVAVTPEGNADSPTQLDDGSLVFAKPWEETQPFREFINYIVEQEADPSTTTTTHAEVRYAQTQNDNLHSEYLPLLPHIPPAIPFARIALQQPAPEAVNLWIGNSRSVTALHRDVYENVYVQVRGWKHFVLVPPLFQPCVNERVLRTSRYMPVEHGDLGGGGREREVGKMRLRLQDDDGEGSEELVPFPIWDPDRPGERTTPYSDMARPMRVTLEPGDMLYLPALWYHKVSQSCSNDGICVAVNYWYDMDFTGSLHPMTLFLRSLTGLDDAMGGSSGLC